MSNSSIGVPPALAAVFGISGGTALISTAWATRWVPCPSEARSHFAAAGEVANVNGVSQFKRFDQRGQIMGGVHRFRSMAASIGGVTLLGRSGGRR